MRSTDSDRLKRLGELVASAAHELNNPLSAVVGFLDLLEEGIEVESVSSLRDKIMIVRDEAQRAARLARGLLSIARAPELELTEIDLAEVARSVCELKRPLLKRDDVELEFDADRPAHVVADHDQIRQVVLNLVTNAEQALEDRAFPRRVRVSARLELSRGILVVEDSGQGVRSEFEKLVFEPFFTTKKKGGKGTGLGLTVSRAIVQAHGGEITLDRGPLLGGARFTISLPTTGTPSGKFRIRPLEALVVDDDLHVRDSLTAVLAAQGHHAHVASGVSEAIQAIASRDDHFDVLLLDMLLADGNGFDVLARALELDDAAARRTVFLTGNSPSQQPLAVHVGAQILLKPISSEALAQALATAAKVPGAHKGIM